MNERIKQLAEQAGLSEGRFERYEGQDCDLKGYSMLPEQMAKFAELIVRECAGIYSKIDNGNQHMGTDDYLEALQKTFRS